MTVQTIKKEEDVIDTSQVKTVIPVPVPMSAFKSSSTTFRRALPTAEVYVR